MNQLRVGAVLSYINIIATVVVGLIYTPIMLRLLGQAEYGLYALIGSVVGYLSILDMGLGNTIVRYISQNRVLGDKKAESELNGLFLAVYFFIGCITVFIGIALYINIDSLFSATFSPDELMRAHIMTGLLIFNFAVSFPLSVFAALMQAYERFIFLRIVNILRVVLAPVIILPFLYMGYGSIMMVVITTVLNILCLLTNIYYCFRYLKIRFFWGYYEKEFLFEIMGYSFFIFLNVVMDKIYWSTGQFILGMVSGTIQVAIYAVAMQFMAMYMQFSTSISSVLLPKVTMLVANGATSKELTNLMIKVGRLQYIVIGYILLLFFLLGREFLYLWAGENYLAAYPMVMILMLALFTPLVQNAGIAILQAKNLNRYRMTVYTIVAVLNIFVSIPLAHLYGGLGCALSTAGALFISTGFFMNRYYKNILGIDIALFWKNILQISRSTWVILLLGICFELRVPLAYNWGMFLLKGCMYSLLYFGSIFFAGMNGYEKNLCRSFLTRFAGRYS